MSVKEKVPELILNNTGQGSTPGDFRVVVQCVKLHHYRFSIAICASGFPICDFRLPIGNSDISPVFHRKSTTGNRQIDKNVHPGYFPAYAASGLCSSVDCRR